MSDDLYDDETDSDEEPEQPSEQNPAAIRVQRKLEKQLAEANLKLGVINAGITGLNPTQERALARELEGKDPTPDAVKAAAQELGYLQTPQVTAELEAHAAQSAMTATPSSPPPPPSGADTLQQMVEQIKNAPPGAFADEGLKAKLQADLFAAIQGAGLEFGSVEQLGDFVPS